MHLFRHRLLPALNSKTCWQWTHLVWRTCSYFRLTVVSGHICRARRWLPSILNSSISWWNTTGRWKIPCVAQWPLCPSFVIVVVVIVSSGGTTTTVVLKIVGAGPDVDVVFGWETGAGRGAVSRVTGWVRALRRGEAHTSGGTARRAGRSGHCRAVAAPVQPDTIHVLRRRIHRMYLEKRSRVPLNHTRDLYFESCLLISIRSVLFSIWDKKYFSLI